MPPSPAAPPPAPAIAQNPLIQWVVSEGFAAPTAAALVAGLSLTLRRLWPRIYRVRVTIRTLHPQYFGTSYTWRDGVEGVEEFTPPNSVVAEERYLKSPYAPLFEGAGAIRRRLRGPGMVIDFPILAELTADGATDYVAMPLVFSDGRIHALTVATRAEEGFPAAMLTQLDQALPILSSNFEIHALRKTATTILDTYLGRQAGRRVLDGLVKRGNGENIHAVLWYCDMRGSTRLADTMPISDFLALLNAYFECTAGSVLEHGGEVLSFIGDAVLALFPINTGASPEPSDASAMPSARAALEAAAVATERVATLSLARASQGRSPVRSGIGLHVGRVHYGNIGVTERLSFTVIGRAINEVARLSSLAKALDRPVVISADLARLAHRPLLSLGFHVLRGVRRPIEVFSLPETQPTPNG
jgi:adenylate cyclase